MKILLYFAIIFCLAAFFSIKVFSQSNISSFTIDASQLDCKKKIWVYLPLDYNQSNEKYPVIYMHDGQNLFSAKNENKWDVDKTLDSVNAQVIVIAIEHGGDKRMDELTSFKNAEYGGGKADDYLDFIINTLKPKIDTTFRTKTNAKNTAIMGSSLGGLVSFYAALKHPTVFGKAGCFSPAFWFNRNEIIDLMQKTTTFKTKVFFLSGDKEGDSETINKMVIDDLNAIELIVNTKRCECKKMNKKVIVKGGQHNEKLWRENFKKAYLWLF